MEVFGFAESTIQLVPDGTLVAHLLMCLVMVAVLDVALYAPITRVLEERERRGKGLLNESREVLARIEEMVSEYEETLRGARSERYQFLKTERANMLGIRENQLTLLRRETSAKAAEELAEIEQQAEVVRRALVTESEHAALEIFSQIVRRPLREFNRLDFGA